MDVNFASKIINKLTSHTFDVLHGSKNVLPHPHEGLSEVQDLPDGSCFSRIFKVYPSEEEKNCKYFIKKCEYVGSFPVHGNDNNSRTEFVKSQLKQMQHITRRKIVLLIISLTGIKVCTVDGKSVLMAHALRRISFSTCDPENRQFSFLAREPNGHFNLQYCHSFLAPDAQTAEEVSACMGRAFRMAYAQQLHTAAPLPLGRPPASPLFHSAAALLHDHSDWMQEEIPATTARASPRPCWARKLIGKTKHNDPLLNQTMELSSRTLSKTVSENGKADNRHSPVISSSPKCSASRNLDFDMWSPHGECSSGEENNSPTNLNSCKQIKDKPPLSKNLQNDFSNTSRIPSASAPPIEEDNLLEITTGTSSKRSSRSSCDQSVPSSSSSSSSDITNLTEISSSETSSCCKSKRISFTASARSTSSITPPPPPERHDSLCTAVSEERELRSAPWFQAGIPREIALEVLEQEPVGSFMVRESTSKPGCFALSLRVPRDFHQSGIAHYLIMRTNRGYKIKGFTKEFGTLMALITHHSVMPELLPCPLSLFRYNPSFKKHDSEDMVDIDEDPDYNLLSDFKKILTDINS